tara:strand:+ start:322 stop:534 length:213 start_codon:yes stop_codon:yes gene_type:complete
MLRVEDLKAMSSFKISEENSRKMKMNIENDGDEEEILQQTENQGLFNPQRRTMNSLPQEKIMLDKETQTN